MAKVVTLRGTGSSLRGENEDALAAQVERHIAEARPDLVGKLSRDDMPPRSARKAKEQRRTVEGVGGPARLPRWKSCVSSR